ncbi:MAG: DUF99 family protein [Deltaproteobacteria bacterium]|nr:DUF99 family protein [Deltaproteobacteria bacterium]
MLESHRPHVLGVDDGPFEKGVSRSVPLVGVTMEGSDLVEAVSVTEFPVDGEDVADFLADWIDGLRVRPALQGIFFGGITIAGLAVIDVRALAERLGVPVAIVNRREPGDARLIEALESAGLAHRRAILERAPRAQCINGRIYASVAGGDFESTTSLVKATIGKSDLPEPLRLAHIIARAIVTGESRGRP